MVKIWIVLVLLGLALVNFWFEWLAIEIFSLLTIVCLVLCGILEPSQAFMGFANSAIVMIAGVMLLTGGLIHNGAAETIAGRIDHLAGRSERKAAVLLYTAVNAVSSVINNVAATAMFIPVAEGMASRFRENRGRYLMPVAFASMTGGMCTLIGTSTNVAVSGALEQYGLEPLGFFELAPVGLLVAGVGILYMLWIAPRLLKLPPEQAPVDTYGIRQFLFEIVVEKVSTIAGKTLAEADLGQVIGVTVLAIVRGEERIVSPGGDETILAGDLLLVEGQAGAIPAVVGAPGLQVKSLPSAEWERLGSDSARVVEATVSYNSSLIGKNLKELDFRHRFGMSVLAIHRRGEVVLDKVGKIRLHAGDVLLVHGRADRIPRLVEEPVNLLLDSASRGPRSPRRALRAALIFATAVAVSALGWLDAPTAFLAGGTLVLVFHCLPADAAASYVNFRFLIMLGGMAALGTAMDHSGAARFLSDLAVRAVPGDHPTLLVAAFFLLTVFLTQPISNAAAALLVLPVAIHAAQSVSVDPRPFAIGVTIAASCSFITPFEPACLLVYSTGKYRFSDFVRVGGLLTVGAFVVSILLIPVLWPYRP